MSTIDQRIRDARSRCEGIKTPIHRKVAMRLVDDLDFSLDSSWLAGSVPTENVKVDHRQPFTFDEALHTVDAMATTALASQALVDQARKLAQLVQQGGDADAQRQAAEDLLALTGTK